MSSIQEQIVVAINAERHNHRLQGALKAKSDRLSRLVHLDDANIDQQLLNFIFLYVEAVPDLLQKMEESTDRNGCARLVQPLLKVSKDFFELAPPSLASHTGLTAILVKSYLVHRLIEEVIDNCLFRTGCTIINMDMALTNAIVHGLIGEPFANEMDELVAQAAQQISHNYRFGQTEEDFLVEQRNCSNLVHIFRPRFSVTKQAGLRAKVG